MSIDCVDVTPAFLYNRKVEEEGTNEEILARNIERAFAHADRLEAEPELKDKLFFNRKNLKFIVNDRLLAPHTPENLEALKSVLNAILPSFVGSKNFSYTPPHDLRDRLSLEVKVD